MELLWEETPFTRLIFSSSDQAVIEGNIPPTEGRVVREVLDCSAKATINDVLAGENEVNATGSITLTTVAVDESGSTFAFESSANYTHRFEAECVSRGMNASVVPSVHALTVRVGDGTVDMSAVIDLDLRVTTSSPLRVIAGVNGVSDLEKRSFTGTVSHRIELGHDTLRMREELAEDGVNDVILVDGQICVRDTVPEQGGVTVSGVIAFTAICANADGELSQLVRQTPFRERLAVNGFAENIYCRAELNGIALRTLGVEFNLLAMEAEVDFHVYGIQTDTISLPTDMFSPTVGYECLRHDARLLSIERGISLQTSFRETITVPEGMADIDMPIFAAARPVITSVQYTDGTVADGILVTRLVYRSSGGKLYTFTEDIPFSIRLADECLHAVVTGCTASAAITAGGGKMAQLSCNVSLDAELFSVEDVSVVTGLAEREREPMPHGIVICLASEGDCFFDIAKRYSVACEHVKSMNPEACEPLSEGQRLLILT